MSRVRGHQPDVEADAGGMRESGGPEYLFGLMLALGTGGLILLFSSFLFEQPGSQRHTAGRRRLWPVRIASLAIATWSLVDLGLWAALRLLLSMLGVGAMVWLALRISRRSGPVAEQRTRPWPVTSANLPLWLGGVLLAAAAGVLTLQMALGRPCS